MRESPASDAGRRLSSAYGHAVLAEESTNLGQDRRAVLRVASERPPEGRAFGKLRQFLFEGVEGIELIILVDRGGIMSFGLGKNGDGRCVGVLADHLLGSLATAARDAEVREPCQLFTSREPSLARSQSLDERDFQARLEAVA